MSLEHFVSRALSSLHSHRPLKPGPTHPYPRIFTSGNELFHISTTKIQAHPGAHCTPTLCSLWLGRSWGVGKGSCCARGCGWGLAGHRAHTFRAWNGTLDDATQPVNAPSKNYFYTLKRLVSVIWAFTLESNSWRFNPLFREVIIAHINRSGGVTELSSPRGGTVTFTSPSLHSVVQCLQYLVPIGMVEYIPLFPWKSVETFRFGC